MVARKQIPAEPPAEARRLPGETAVAAKAAVAARAAATILIVGFGIAIGRATARIARRATRMTRRREFLRR